VFNFWEPLHYLDRGHGFQTWETSPEYAIRSYAYIALHLVPVKISRFLFGDQKVRLEEFVPLDLLLIIPVSADRFLCIAWDPLSRVDPVRGKVLSDGP
jgi:hypothetical protein